jgi:glutamine amidotransferase
MVRVCILNYGSGNVGSVFNLFSSLDVAVKVSNESSSDMEQATHLVMPGVGAFGAAMRKIRNTLPLESLENAVLRGGKPFLGICVGMQVLADIGMEFGEHRGLGWIPGRVEKLDARDLRLPHIGWNDVTPSRDDPLLHELQTKTDFYFLHSFVFQPDRTEDTVATAEFGASFCAIVQRDNIRGVQFHPEKSQRAGLQLARNFLGTS